MCHEGRTYSGLAISKLESRSNDLCLSPGQGPCFLALCWLRQCLSPTRSSKCNLTELTTRCTSLTSGVSGVDTGVCACARISQVLGPKGIVDVLHFSQHFLGHGNSVFRGCFPSPVLSSPSKLFYQCDEHLVFLTSIWRLTTRLPGFASCVISLPLVAGSQLWKLLGLGHPISIFRGGW